MNILYSDKDVIKIEEAKNNSEDMLKHGIRYCTIADECYPRTLRKIANRPPVLYYKGNIEILNDRHGLAVIGGRKCSKKAEELAFETGKYCAEYNVNVINGLALGCDTAALRGALSNGGTCVAIIPCGLDNIYPQSNSELADEIILHGGCLITEYSIGSELRKYQYVERDRLQSGVSDGVLVVEAECESGTMHTVEYAKQQYRRLACYWNALFGNGKATGNKYMQESSGTKIICSRNDLNNFLTDIINEPYYEQMSLFSDEW